MELELKVGDIVYINDKYLPINDNWLGEGGKIKHQGPYKITRIHGGVVRKLDNITVYLAFGRFRKPNNLYKIY